MQKLFLIFFGILFFTACDSSRIYEEFQSISDLKWSKSETLTFEVEIEDTASAYNEIIAIRHAEGYPFENLRVKITKKAPSGKTEEQDYNFNLRNEDNMWKGSGMGDVYDLELPFQENITYPEAGTYTYALTHTMQHEEIPLIIEIGLVVRKK